MFHIFIISLQNSPRRAFMQEQCTHLDRGICQVHFFDAIDFRTNASPALNSKIKPLWNRIYWGRELSISELGCFGSHYSLWEKCIELNAPIIVLEDDVKLESFFMQGLQEIDQSGFEYVRLMGLFDVKIEPIKTKSAESKLAESTTKTQHFFKTTDQIAGTQGYYLTPNAAKKFIAKLHSFCMPVDDYMDCFFIHKVGNILYKPYLIAPAELESTISGRIKQPFSVFKITRECFRLWRKLRRLLHCL